MELHSDIKQRKACVSNSASLCDTEGKAAVEGTNLLSDAGVRSKTAISGSSVTLNNESSDFSSDVTLNAQAVSKAALEEAESLSNMVRKFKSFVNVAEIVMAVSREVIDPYLNTGKSLDTARFHLLYLKNRAENAQRNAEIVADNIKKAENTLSTLGVESNTAEDVELMELKIRREIDAAYRSKNSVYETAYLLLKSTEEFWRKMEEGIDMHSRHLFFRQRQRTSEWTAGLIAMTFMLGFALFSCYCYLKVERDSEDLFLLVGCLFIISRVLIELVETVDYFPMKSDNKFTTTLKVLEENLKEMEIFRTQRTSTFS